MIDQLARILEVDTKLDPINQKLQKLDKTSLNTAN